MSQGLGIRDWGLASLVAMLLLTASPATRTATIGSVEVRQGPAGRRGRARLSMSRGISSPTGRSTRRWSSRKVDFKGIPFFALSHAPDLSPRREYVVSSAGFWAQYLYSEQILTHHPNLRNEQSPLRKGLLTFHVATSLVYAGAAFGKTGPTERDTRGMASSRRISERWIGAMVLAPAAPRCVSLLQPGRALGGLGLKRDEDRERAAGVEVTGYAGILPSRGPSANVIVPSTTILPSTRASPARTPMRLRRRLTVTSMTT